MIERSEYVDRISAEFEVHSVVAILGPRQIGKTIGIYTLSNYLNELPTIKSILISRYAHNLVYNKECYKYGTTVVIKTELDIPFGIQFDFVICDEIDLSFEYIKDRFRNDTRIIYLKSFDII